MSGCRQLDSRLVVPPLPPRQVWRRRLITALDSADVPLVLLAAGPGAGKTVLLSEWVLRHDGPVAWMTMTAGDVAPPRFWHLLWSALRACGAQDDGLSPVTAGTDSTERVQALLARLPEALVQPVLVIDDAHQLTDPDVLADLDEIIRSGAPPRLRLVLAARSDPLLPLHRYRLAGQMHELRADALAVTRGELEELLAMRNYQPVTGTRQGRPLRGRLLGVAAVAVAVAATATPAAAGSAASPAPGPGIR